VVHIGLLCTDTNTIHTLPNKRPVFVNPPNSLNRQIFRKRIMAD